VYSSPQVVDDKGHFIRKGNSRHFSREGLLQGMLVGHFRFFRKRDWMRTTGFDENLTNAVDFDMFLKLAEVCDFHHIDDENYCYRWHGSNTSIVKREEQEKSHFIVINRALQRMRLNEWEAVQADKEKPRSVKFQRKPKYKQTRNISFVKNNIQHLIFRNNFIYVKSYNFIFCYVPKVACTGFKQSFRKLEGLPFVQDNDVHRKDNGLNYLQHMSEQEAITLLNNPEVLKITFTRNPYSRVLSAYLNKIKNNPEFVKKHKIDKIIRNKINPKLSEAKFISFADYVEYLCITKDEFLNEHFTSQTYLTGINDAVKFDFIGQFETFNTDIQQFEQRIGALLSFPSIKQQNRTPTNASLLMQDYYTEELNLKIAERFQQDFKNFLYEF